jgi:hypothetical protein
MNYIRGQVLLAVAALALLPYLADPAEDPMPAQDAPPKVEVLDQKAAAPAKPAPAAEKKSAPPAKAAQPAKVIAVAPAKVVQPAQKKAAAPAKAAAPGPKKPDDQNEALTQQFEQQFGKQFQHLYRTELHLLRVVCKLTKPQYQKVAADGEPALKATKQKFLGYWRNQQQGRWDHSGSAQADPRETLSAEMEKALQKTLTLEQAAAYKKERNLRTAAQRRAVVKTLIVMMDRPLVLSAEQRDKIHEVLDKSWNDSWYTYVVRFGGNYFPAMPDAKILPILNDNQKSIWNGLQKPNIMYGFYGLDMGNVGEFEETWDDDVPAKSTQPEPEKKAVKKSKHPSNKTEK